MELIRAHQIFKQFGEGGDRRTILNNISIDIHEGEFVTIMGPSGSGKSTLMYALSGMEHLDSGKVIFGGCDISKLKENELADLRRRRMGFVFQQPTFLKNLNVLDNIILPAVRENKRKRREIIARAELLMDSVEISDLGKRDITQVSGGQLQRAGICRALMNHPSVVFGDEPTGALNSSSSREIMNIFSDMNRKGTTIALVTHDAKVSAVAERVVFLSDGKIVSEMRLSKYEGGALETRVLRISEKLMELGI